MFRLRALIATLVIAGASRASSDDFASLAAVARDLAASADTRTAAAGVLVARSEDPAARRELERLLTSADAGLTPALSAMARASTVPQGLVQLLARLADGSSEAALPAVLRAVPPTRSREGAAMLLRFADTARPPAVRAAAFDNLARLSGRADLGTDAAQWFAWLESVRSMSEAQWSAELIGALARSADSLAAEARSASGRVVVALRRLYMATPPAERSGLLTAMLTDDAADTRSLGFELASRELSASRRLDDSVGHAALLLLAHADPAVRAGAAALVNRLNPAGSEARVLESLARETDPAAASAMIIAAARRPSAGGIEAVFRWLDKRGPAFGAAVDATWSLLRSGHLSRPGDAARVLRALSATPDSELTPACCAMLGSIGGTDGLDRLALVLRTGSISLRVAAAQALVLSPDWLDAILHAAADEPQLFETAAQGVMMHRPTAAAFRAVSTLPPPSPESQRRSLLLIAAQLPATDLLDVARESSNDMALRESYLTLLASPNRTLSERADPARLSAIAEGVILLARTRLSLDRPDAAVAALDALPELADLVDHLRVSRLRALAMLCLNRTEEAASLGAPANVWLDALERCVNKPFAPALAAQIRTRFGDELATDEAARLTRLTELLPHEVSASGDDELVGPPVPAGG